MKIKEILKSIIKNKNIKFVFLILIGLWNIFSFFLLFPMFLGLILGDILLEENIISGIKNSIWLIFLCVAPMMLFFKMLKNYKFKHFLIIAIFFILFFLWKL